MKWIKKKFDFLKNWFIDQFLNDEIPMEIQLSNLIIICIMVGCLIAFAFSLVLNQSIGTSVTVLGTFFLLAFCIYMSIWKNKAKLSALIVMLVINEVIFPVMFVYSGGLHSGMICYLIVGLIYPFLSLSGIASFVTFILAAITSGGMIALEYFGYIKIEPLTEGGWVEDSIQSMIIVALVFGIIFKFQSFVYIRKNNRLKQQEMELRDALLKLENANNAKSDFLANMSHEIRTPINAVLGLNEMILRECPDENSVNYAYDIKAASTSLLNIINDILDFSKIESGKMELVPVDYDLSSVLDDITNMIGIMADNKGLAFAVIVDPDIPRILHGDEVRVKQIMLNILNNAVKYTKEGSINFTIDFEKIDDDNIMLKVYIADTGVGMKPEDIDRMFKPFERLESSKNRHIEGTGLGMTITKTFLNMMGSDLKVESKYGEGSVFSFSLVQPVAEWSPMSEYSEKEKRADKHDNIYRTGFVSPESYVLVVDDMPLNLKVFAGLLKDTQMVIDTVESGREAIELCKKYKYDIIFMDHMMPEMDGVETFEVIRSAEDSLNRETPTIILTANAISGAKEKYISCGFDDYLSKPINPAHLEKMLLEYLTAEKVTLVETDIEAFAPKGESELTTRLREMSDMDVDKGIELSGGEDLFKVVVSEYYLTGANKLKLIRELYEGADITNYTIQVHSLKSSSKMAGFLELSEMARLLEEAGLSNDTATIERDTPAMLSAYERILNELAPVFEGDEQDKPLIEDDKLLDIFKNMKAAAGDFDIGLCEEFIDELSTFSIKDEYKELYKKLKIAVAELEYEEIEELLENFD